MNNVIPLAERPTASRKARLASFLLDQLLFFLWWVPFVALTGSVLFWGRDPEAAEPVSELALVFAVVGLVGTLLLLAYQIRLAMRGLSIGNRAVGVQVLRLDTGGPPGFVRGVLLRRWGWSLLSILAGTTEWVMGADIAGALSWLVSLLAVTDVLWIFGTRRRCLHDRLAGTVVVSTDPLAVLVP